MAIQDTGTKPDDKKPDPKPDDGKKPDPKDGEKDKEEEGEEEEEDAGETLESVKAHNAKLKEEAKTKRLQNKELKEKLARQDKALAILQGKPEGDINPLEAAKAASDVKMSKALIRAELASVARDAHDPADLLAIAPHLFKDVTVDLDGETVDRGELKEAVAKLRKEKPHLFQPKDSGKGGGTGDEKDPIKGARLPPDGGHGSGTGTHIQNWKQLKEQGRTAEAQEYYAKNRVAILAQMKAAG